MKTAVVSFIALLALVTKAWSQVTDTVILDDVTVQALKLVKTEHPDILPLPDHHRNANLGAFLASLGGFAVRQYSPGGSATVAPRGYTPQQVTVKWNNVDVTNPMLGQTDLSLLPVFFFDVAEAVTQPSISDNAPAGSVNVSDLFQRDAIYVALHNHYSSLNNLTNALQIKTGSKRWFTSLNLFNEQNENSFRFRNTTFANDTMTTLSHAEGTGRGASAGVKYMNGAHAFRAGGYALSLQRNIPPTMLQPEGKDEQDDASAVGFLRYEHMKKTALVTDVSAAANAIVFRDGFTNVHYDSRSVVYRSSVSWSRRWRVFEVNGKAHTALFTATVLPDVYKRSEWQHALEAGSTVRFNRLRLRFEVQGAQRFREADILPFNYSATLVWFPLDLLTFNLTRARIGRLPGLNDRYWQPGGNPDLKSELADRHAFTIVCMPNTARNLETTIRCDTYYDEVNNWIQWVPNGPFWSPRNVKSVLLYGVEPSLNVAYNFRDRAAGVKVSYRYNKAVTKASFQPNDASLEKQLTYVPLQTVHAHAFVETKRTSVFAAANFFSPRFITSDNAQQLDSYATLDVGVSHTIPLNRFAITIGGKVDNATGTDYQTVAWRPMPRQVFSGALILQYNKPYENNKQD